MTFSPSADVPNRPPYPSDASNEVLPLYSVWCKDSAEIEVIGSLISKLLPPPNVHVFAEAGIILEAVGLIAGAEADALRHFAERNSEKPTLTKVARQKRHPLCFALLRLFKRGKEFPDTRDQSIRTLFACAQNRPSRQNFSPDMYYKHVIALRDVMELYWQVVGAARRRGDVSRGDKWQDLITFVENPESDVLLSDNERTKCLMTSHLLDGSLLLGLAMPRGEIERKRHCQIGSRLSVSEDLRAESQSTVYIQAAVVAEPFLDDDGLHAEIQYPEGATFVDRQKVNRGALAGFARTNVRNVADMNALSAVTYRSYLTYAAVSLPQPEYALTWLAAYPGIDISRRIAISHADDHMPFNDFLVVDRSNLQVRYNVLRRLGATEPALYENAGVMCLPVPDGVHQGLLEICKTDNQPVVLLSCNQVAKVFAQKSGGLTPTWRRLRASARIFVAPKQFTELEFSALSGRVVPALKGISAYYPNQVTALVKKFTLAYRAILSELDITAPSPDEIPRLTDEPRHQLFCRPSPGLAAVKKLILAISKTYASCCARVKSEGSLATIEQVISAVVLHETACYVMQEIAIGIRPIGDVADFRAVSPKFGAMVMDKGSRLFSERSFSPLSERHSCILACSSENRERLRCVLADRGHKLDDNKDSSLACEVNLLPDENGFQLARMTNRFFRTNAPIASTSIDRNYAPNWLRHVAAEYLQGKAPQWQLDEFFGHQRIGRESMVKWSTAGLAHFESLKTVTEDLVSQLIDDNLLMPIPTFLSSLRGNRP